MQKALWLRCSLVEDPLGIFSFVAPRQRAFCTKTLRAAGLLAVDCVGSVLTARCGDARTSPPRPRPKSPAAASLRIFRRSLSTTSPRPSPPLRGGEGEEIAGSLWSKGQRALISQAVGGRASLRRLLRVFKASSRNRRAIDRRGVGRGGCGPIARNLPARRARHGGRRAVKGFPRGVNKRGSVSRAAGD